MSIIIGIHIDGNGLEYVLDSKGNTMCFDNKEEAEDFLVENGESPERLEWYVFKEVE